MKIIEIFSALLTPIIAIIAVYVAFQQYLINKRNSEQQFYINKRKLNLDLYQKRFSIFSTTKNILLKINQNAQIDIIELRDFKFGTNESKFLFEEDIIEFLEELQKKSLAITHLFEDLKNVNSFPVGSYEREQKVNEYGLLIHWFTNEYEHLEVRFMKYLDFKNL